MKSEEEFNNSNATQDKVFVKKKRMSNKVKKKKEKTTLLVPYEKVELGTYLDRLD